MEGRPRTGRRMLAAVVLAGAALLSGCAGTMHRDGDGAASPRTERSDAEMRRAVRDRLLAADIANAGYWDIDVRGGTVYIFGTARSHWDRMKAEGLAAELPGVDRVVAIVNVGPWVWTNPTR